MKGWLGSVKPSWAHRQSRLICTISSRPSFSARIRCRSRRAITSFPTIWVGGPPESKRAEILLSTSRFGIYSRKHTAVLYARCWGGKSRNSIQICNTCAGYKYIRDARAQAVANWHVGEQGGPYEDLEGFLYRADEVARSLLEQGITAMKIWPGGRALGRAGHYPTGDAHRIGALCEDPQSGWRQDADHGRVCRGGKRCGIPFRNSERIHGNRVFADGKLTVIAERILV
jgi:hypothetical protein